MKTSIEPQTIAKYYIIIELRKLLDNQNSKSKLKQFADTLDANEVLEFLKLTSVHYRNNNVFYNLKTANLIWYKERVNIKDILLTDVNDKVKPYLEKAEYQLIKFKELISKNGAIVDLEEFKPRVVSAEDSIFILKKEGDRFKVVDGIHRIVSLSLQGHTDFEGYVGYNEV